MLRGHQVEPNGSGKTGQAVAWATERNFEREAVAEERAILRDALNRGRGIVTLAAP
jgi:hypothetical protein